jgi:hypothetical protein
MRNLACRARGWCSLTVSLVVATCAMCAACGRSASTASTEGAAPVVVPAVAAGNAAAPTSTSPGSTAGTAGVASDGSQGAAGAEALTDTNDTNNSALPCTVAEALARACHKCHGPKPANGAPMSLVVPADFQRLRITKPRIPNYQNALMRLDGSAQPQMPPTGSEITNEDKTTLIDWLSSGAPAASSSAAACPQ